MTWFNILKNEMRSINLPKFKVKPFNVNKPDEEDNECERKVKEIEKKFYDRQFFNQSEVSSLEEKLQHPYFYVEVVRRDHGPNRQSLRIKYIPKISFKGNSWLKIRIVIDNDKWLSTFAHSKLNEEDYCRVLDAMQRDEDLKSGTAFDEGAIRYFTTDGLGASDDDGEFVVDELSNKPILESSADSFIRYRGLIFNKDGHDTLPTDIIRMDVELDVYVSYLGIIDITTIPKSARKSLIDGFNLLADYINNINIKFTE